MKKCAIICILLVLAAGLNATGAVRVTNLYLEKNSQYTEFTIACDRDFSFEHQIVEADQNRPFRIVVDVLDAVHRLPQWDFEELPQGSIARVRTSQFSIEPREVVRIVLDVQGALTYKVKKSDNNLTLFVNTPDEPKFQQWVAVTDPPAQPTLALNFESVAARPGNEANAPQLKKSNEPSPPQLVTAPPPASADLSAFTDLLVDADTDPSQLKSGGIEKIEKPQATGVTIKAKAKAKAKAQPQVVKPINESVKQVDSAILTPMVPSAVPDIKASETEVQPKPKSQKSALPETKVTSKPQLAQQESGATEQQPSSAAAESIRQKYAAKLQGDSFDQLKATGAQFEEKPVLGKVERIRQKYSRGIHFVADDEDEARLEAQAEERRLAAEQHPDEVTRFYDEFIPEREVVVYVLDGQRDPFAPLVDLVDENADMSDLPDVNTLRLIGVLQEAENSRALFEDYSGYAYIMETGDRVRNGFLASVHEDHVVFQIRQYGWSRQVAVQLEDEI